MEPRTWRDTGLVDHLLEQHRQMGNRAFCFVLGAGASVTSGIPAGGALAWRWLEELHAREGRDGEALEAWVRRGGLGEVGPPGLSADELLTQPARAYPRLFERRFGDDRAAADHHDRAVRSDPDSPSVREARAAFRLHRLADRSGAREDLDAALSRRAGDPRLLGRRSELRLWEGEAEAAHRDACRMEERAPPGWPLRPAAWWLRAVSARADGEADAEALQHLVHHLSGDRVPRCPWRVSEVMAGVPSDDLSDKDRQMFTEAAHALEEGRAAPELSRFTGWPQDG